MTEERIERTFEVGASAQVEIGNVAGAIDIRGWDRPEVHIIAVKHGQDEGITVEMGADGSRVWARTRTDEGAARLFGWLKRGGQQIAVDYQVDVPHASRVSVSGVSGPVTVAGVTEEVAVHSVNGPIVLRDVAGDISARTVNSNIDGRRIEGTLSVETVSGRVDVADSRLSRLRAESVDGSIRAAGQIDNLRAEAINGAVRLTSRLNPKGEYVVRTVNGTFHLAVPDDTACAVSAAGVNVQVVCELAHSVEEQRWGKWAGQVGNGGGADVRFDTVNGTLKILSAEGRRAAGPAGEAEEVVPRRPAAPAREPEAEVAAPEPARPQLSKMDILKAVEEGEMAVDEALERLRKLS